MGPREILVGLRREGAAPCEGLFFFAGSTAGRAARWLLVPGAISLFSLTPGLVYSAWRVTESADPMDDKKTIVAQLDATESPDDSAGWRIPGWVFVRCEKGSTDTLDVYVAWGRGIVVLDEPINVRYRIDEQPVIEDRWSRGRTGQAAFYRGEPLEFLVALSKGRIFRFEVGPQRDIRKFFRFDLTGAQEGVGEALARCLELPGDASKDLQTWARRWLDAKHRLTEQELDGILLDIKLKDYYARADRAIWSYWTVPASANRSGAEVRAAVRVARDGRVLATEIIMSSGDAVLDESVQKALRAVREANLPSLPAEYPEETLEFSTSFKPPES